MRTYYQEMEKSAFNNEEVYWMKIVKSGMEQGYTFKRMLSSLARSWNPFVYKIQQQIQQMGTFQREEYMFQM